MPSFLCYVVVVNISLDAVLDSEFFTFCPEYHREKFSE